MINRLVMLSSIIITLSLLFACAAKTIYITRQLPIIDPPDLVKIHLPQCTPTQKECINPDTIRAIDAKNAKRESYEEQMRQAILSTHEKQ